MIKFLLSFYILESYFTESECTPVFISLWLISESRAFAPLSSVLLSTNQHYFSHVYLRPIPMLKKLGFRYCDFVVVRKSVKASTLSNGALKSSAC